jgi:drug/metabolite transporter (DMT)-like permease
MRPGGSNYLQGAVFGFAAASIWAGWSAITRLAVTTSLDPWDIATLRFGLAGLLLSPVVARRCRRCSPYRCSGSGRPKQNGSASS